MFSVSTFSNDDSNRTGWDQILIEGNKYLIANKDSSKVQADWILKKV